MRRTYLISPFINMDLDQYYQYAAISICIHYKVQISWWAGMRMGYGVMGLIISTIAYLSGTAGSQGFNSRPRGVVLVVSYFSLPGILVRLRN